MIVKLNGIDYEIRFFHGYWDRRFTTCKIIAHSALLPNNKESIMRNASCSKKDNFTKSKGRKISLGRALIEAGFSRNERNEIWRQYFEVCKK